MGQNSQMLEYVGDPCMAKMGWWYGGPIKMTKNLNLKEN